MAIKEPGDLGAAVSGLSSVEDTGWYALGRVIYGWTDRRDRAVDRAWWQVPRLRRYHPMAHKPEGAERTNVPHVAARANRHSVTSAVA